MKLTRENIYIDLRGKSKEELTELYDFLISVGEKPYRDKERFLNYSNDDEKVGFSGVHFCGLGDLYKEKNEVTIEDLKEILKMTRNQELREEAKKRGYTHDNFKCLNKRINQTSIENLDKWYYDELEDTLFTNTRKYGGKAVYKNGVWAEIVKPMETFTSVAMRCTQEQFDAVKPKLKGLSIENISPFSQCNYLVNNLGGFEKLISNVTFNSKVNYNREVHEEWNEEVFLKACGIEAETQEEQLRKEAIERGFVNGVEFFGSQGIESDKPMLICDNIRYEKPKEGINIWGLYVNNSWLCYNGTWGTLAEETLEQQLEKAEAEVKRLREAIEEENNIKIGDWCKFWDGDKDEFIISKLQKNLHGTYITSGKHFLNCEKITDSVLLESLNRLF